MLDEEQRAAVEGAGGRTLILAAAGSGKTRTIVALLAHRVEAGTPPEQIMLVTFTRRAAREMVQRAERTAGVDLARVTAGTFHSVARRILVRHGSLVGVPSAFTVLDGEDQAEVASLARDEVLAGRTRPPSMPRPPQMVAMFGLAAELGRPLEEVVVGANPRLGDRMEEITAIAAAYEARKREIDALDYADLLVLTDRLLAEHPSVRERLSAAHPWVLVDELHDTSPVQARLVEAIAGDAGNLVAVADPDQSIYSWRGADPDVVRRFAEAPGTRVFPLSTNYRSSPEIVALAQETLPAGNPFGKSMRAHRPRVGMAPVVAHLAGVPDEASFVTQRIAELITEGRDPGDIAVLYRAHHHSMDLQLALTEAGVEYELYSGARFVESAHVKDVLAFCRLRHNPVTGWPGAVPCASSRASVRPPRTRMWDRVRTADDPLAAGAALTLPGAGRQAAERVAATIGAVAAMDRPEEIVLRIARADWYGDHLRGTYPNWRDREGDLARLAELAARSDGLDHFLAEMQLAERVEADEDVSGPARRVALTSVHQAKGLEWPVVFVLQVEPGSFPSGWAVSEGNLD